VLVGALVEEAAVARPGHVLHGQHHPGVVGPSGAAGQGHRRLHRRQRGAGVALARRHHRVDGVVLGVGPFHVQPTPDQRAQVVRRQGVQPPQ